MHFTTVRLLDVCICLSRLAAMCVGVNKYSGRRECVSAFKDNHLSSHCHMNYISMNLCACVSTITKICASFTPSHSHTQIPAGYFSTSLVYSLRSNPEYI